MLMLLAPLALRPGPLRCLPNNHYAASPSDLLRIEGVDYPNDGSIIPLLGATLKRHKTRYEAALTVGRRATARFETQLMNGNANSPKPVREELRQEMLQLQLEEYARDKKEKRKKKREAKLLQQTPLITDREFSVDPGYYG